MKFQSKCISTTHITKSNRITKSFLVNSNIFRWQNKRKMKLGRTQQKDQNKRKKLVGMINNY